MATPRGAEHRDIEQRLRRIEYQVAAVIGAALRRKQLSVTSGDFTVSGGGSVVVEDGGGIAIGVDGRFTTAYDTGLVGVYVGPFSHAGDGHGLFVQGPSGQDVFLAWKPDGSAGQVSLGSSADTLESVYAYTQQFGVIGPLTAYDGLSVNNELAYFGAPTTGDAANLNYNGANAVIRVVTSSRRYKQDIEDAPDQATNLLGVKGRTWRDRTEVAEDPDTEARHVGYIAEELDAAGLSEYVKRDDQGRPDAIRYDRLTVPLVQLAQRQQAQLDAQAEQIADLVRRVDAL